MESAPADQSQAQDGGLRIRLIGDLQVLRGSRVVALPASKRTRALLGYLAAVGGPQSRQNLCDLLWDGPDDPRAALRWSLTKLRPVINDATTARLNADRERVTFAAHGAFVDVARIGTLLVDGVAKASDGALESAALLLQGEFLDGLDLPACYRFHHWCMAERERLGALRRALLGELIGRLADHPARALPYARALVAADPLAESAHAGLVRSLAALGRPREAKAHHAYASEMLCRELAAPLSGELNRAMRETHAQRPSLARGKPADLPPPQAEPPERSEAKPRAPLIGRETERRAIAASLAALSAGVSAGKLLLFLGEPGIGKTRLLTELAENARNAGARIVAARCFEAETVRPYGSWVDALRGITADAVPSAVRGDLALLVPSLGIAADQEGDRTRLFAAVATLLQALAATQPLVLLLDDLQWVDEASASLLHYLVRTSERSSRLVLAGAARQGEIDDNPWAKRLVASLTRDRCLDQLEVAPLGEAEIAALVNPATADAAAVFRASGGNPLFALEFARAEQDAAGAEHRTIEALISERIERLEESGRELVVWAAAIGREFRPELLAAAMDVQEPSLLARLERLERRGLVRPTSDGQFDFAHDLVRQATYRALSQPRRRLIHRRIAGALSAAAASDDALHGDVVHHAGLAGEHALAVGACIAAGDRCLRMFANAEAIAVAERGLAHLRALPAGAAQLRFHVALLRVKVCATGSRERRTSELVKELQEVAKAAELLGLHGEAASALHLTSWLMQQANDIEQTRHATLRAEVVSRTTDQATRCQQLANTGRCLLEVESQVAHAIELLREAQSLADQLNLHVTELEWGQALAARWAGELDLAHESMSRAQELAHLREDRWRELECFVWLAMIDLERGRFADVELHCDAVARVAERTGVIQAPVADALRAVARLGAHRQKADVAMKRWIAELRNFDDKAHLAYILNHVAAFELDNARPDHAQAAAAEALAMARAVRRTTEIAVASSILVCVAMERGDDHADDVARLSEFASACATGQLSARARLYVDRAMNCAAPARSNAGSNEVKVRLQP